MRRFSKRLFAFLMTAILITLSAAQVFGAVMEHEGLNVTIEMDKEVYEQDEPITAKITVLNTNQTEVTIINLEQLVPEGYELAKDSEVNVENVTLIPGESIVLSVVYADIIEPDEAEESTAESFFDKLIFGETIGIPNILIALVLIIAFIVFMKLT